MILYTKPEALDDTKRRMGQTYATPAQAKGTTGKKPVPDAKADKSKGARED